MNRKIGFLFLFSILILNLVPLIDSSGQTVKSPPNSNGLSRHVIEGHEVVTSKDGSVLYEYPTYGWEIQSNEGFGLFIDYDFSVIGGRTLKNLQENPWREWNLTWTQKPSYEQHSTNGTLLAVYENPIPKIKEIFEASKAIAENDTVTQKEGEIVLVSKPAKTAKSKTQLAEEYKSEKLVKLSEKYEGLGFTNQTFQDEAAKLELSYIGGNFFVLDSRGSYVTGLALDTLFEKTPPSKIDLLGNGSLTFKLRNWKQGVRFKIGDPTYTYSTSTNTITATGGTSGAPITFNDLWTADKAGSLDLASRAGISAIDGSPVALTYNLRPTDYYVLGGAAQDLYITVSSFTGLTSATISIVGTDTAGAAQSETLVFVGNGVQYATKYYHTLTISQVTVFVGVGSFTYVVSHGQWGVVWKQGTSQYVFDCRLQIGDGSTTTVFTDTVKQIISSATVGLSYGQEWMYIKGAATFTSGSVLNSTNKSTANGCDFTFLGTTAEAYFIRSETNGIIYLYSSKFYSGRGDIYLRYIPSPSCIWNCIFVGNVFLRDSNFDIFNMYASDVHAGNSPLKSISGTFDMILIFNCDYALTLYKWGGYPATDSSMTYINLKARNCVTSTFRVENDKVNDDYIVNADLDFWTFTWFGSGSHHIVRQHTFNIKIFDSTGAAISSATVTLKNNAGTNVFSVSTAGDGTIAEQTVSRGYYAQATGNTLQDYGPFDLTISKAGYMIYTHNDIVLDELIDWRISLSKGGLGLEFIAFIIALAALACMLLYWKGKG